MRKKDFSSLVFIYKEFPKICQDSLETLGVWGQHFKDR